MLLLYFPLVELGPVYGIKPVVFGPGAQTSYGTAHVCIIVVKI